LRLGVDTKHQYMRDCSRLSGGDASFPRAERAEREILHLPAYPELSESQIDGVADKVARVLDSLGIAGKPLTGSTASSESASDAPDSRRAGSGGVRG
jgi:hypothetical protein